MNVVKVLVATCRNISLSKHLLANPQALLAMTIGQVPNWAILGPENQFG